jgi:hypothetical protein
MFFFSWSADLRILQIGRANGEWYDHKANGMITIRLFFPPSDKKTSVLRLDD